MLSRAREPAGRGFESCDLATSGEALESRDQLVRTHSHGNGAGDTSMSRRRAASGRRACCETASQRFFKLSTMVCRRRP